MSELVSITQAVVDQLNTAEFDQDFVAERVYIPEYDTATTTALKVYVLGLAETVAGRVTSL